MMRDSVMDENFSISIKFSVKFSFIRSREIPGKNPLEVWEWLWEAYGARGSHYWGSLEKSLIRGS